MNSALHPWLWVLLGGALAFACLVTQVLPLLWPARGRPPGRHRRLEYCSAWVLVGGVGVQATLGLVWAGSRLSLPKALSVSGTDLDLDTPPELMERWLRARQRLEQWRVRGAGRDGGVAWVLSETVDRPVLFGLNPPRLYVPFDWLDQGGDLGEGLVAMGAWAQRRTYQAWMMFWWASQLDLLLAPASRWMGWAIGRAWSRELAGCVPWPGGRGYEVDPPSSLRVGIRLAAPEPERLIPDRTEPRWLFLLVASGTILVVGSGLALHRMGGLNINQFLEFVMNKEIIGFSVHGFDPSVEFRALPGEGGILPDGLMVDTLGAGRSAGCATVRVPLGLFEHEKWIPFGAQAVRVRLAWQVLDRGVKAIDCPAVKLATSEQGVIDGEGQQLLRTYYAHHIFLGEDGAREGVIDLPILVSTQDRHLPGSRDVVYGPLLYIPEGWRIAFRAYQVDPIEPSEVGPMPDGEGERFVAWYRRNGLKPATIDFEWREVPQGAH